MANQPRQRGRPTPGRPDPGRHAGRPARVHARAGKPYTRTADPVLDAIAARVSGDMVNAGIASIDAVWSAGEALDHQLEVYTRLACRASLRYTAGLWTLIAWIHWRTGDRQAAWPALDLAMELDGDVDAAHYLSVFMYDWADPHRVPPVRFR